jgi:hypothetical protein
MNAIHSAEQLMIYSTIIKILNTLGFVRYVAPIVKGEKSELITISEILDNETLNRNQKKLLLLAYRFSIENRL